MQDISPLRNVGARDEEIGENACLSYSFPCGEPVEAHVEWMPGDIVDLDVKFLAFISAGIQAVAFGVYAILLW